MAQGRRIVALFDFGVEDRTVALAHRFDEIRVVIAPGVALIAGLGWLIYDEGVDAWLWLGGLVIFLGAMINLRGERPR